MNNSLRPVCEFSAEIVSFLYQENGPHDDSLFQAHLPNCAECSNELANFADVRGLITDWRTTEFSPLELPKIAIPYHEAQITSPHFSAGSGFSERLREMFSFLHFKPVLAMSLLLLAGISTLLIVEKLRQPLISTTQANSDFTRLENTGRQNKPLEIASNNLEPEKNSDSGKVETKALNLSLKVKTESSKIFAAPPQNRSQALKTETAVKSNVVPNPLKNSGSRQISVQTVAVNQTKIKRSANLSIEDDEISDNSLRLADLFDETGK